MKNVNLFNDEVQFSPAFNIIDDEHHSLLSPGFSIFTDDIGEVYPRHASASPGRRSVRRPRIDRIGKTSSILADVTGASLNRKTPSRAAYLDSPIRRKSPSKTAETDDILVAAGKEDLFGLEFLEDEDVDELGGMDLLQGFQKIGGQKDSVSSARKLARPPLGSRSQTSRF